MEALIYTRPYCTDNGVDYCCFCRPSILSDKEYSEALHHARNVMNTELDGDIQNECRWHILRISDYILVGVATTRFGRKDQVNRQIRGYYGILMPKDSAFIPNWESFEYLDSAHVAPLFEAKQPFSPVSPALVAESAIAPYANEEEYNVPIDFNFEKDKIKIMPVPEARELSSLLWNALKCAKTHTGFNFAYGLNTKYYASSKPFMNVFCYEVKGACVVLLPITRQGPSITSSKISVHQNNNYVPPSTCREQEEVHNERVDGSRNFRQKQNNRIPATEKIPTTDHAPVIRLAEKVILAIAEKFFSVKNIDKNYPTDGHNKWGNLESDGVKQSPEIHVNDTYPYCHDFSNDDDRKTHQPEIQTKNQYKMGLRSKNKRGDSKS